MKTYRHGFNLRWGNKIIIAPRYFSIFDSTYFIHIVDSYCQYVDIWLKLYYIDNGNINVIYNSRLKLYSNSKGLYFNFSYWIDNSKKRKIRVYICD